MSSATLAQLSQKARFTVNRKSQVRLFVLAIFASDALMLALSFIIASFIRFKSGLPLFEDYPASAETHILIAIVLLPFWLETFALAQLYNTHYLFGSTQEYKKIFNASSAVFTLVIVLTFLAPVVRVSRGWIVIAFTCATTLVTVGRFALRQAAHLLRANGFLTARTLIVGTDEEARAIGAQLAGKASSGVEVVGFVEDNDKSNSAANSDIPVVGKVDALARLVPQLGIDQLIVSPSALTRKSLTATFQLFGNSTDVDLRFSPGLFEIYTSGVQVKEIGNVHLVSMKKERLDAIESSIKSIFDYTVALLSLIVLIPLFIVVALLIKLDSRGPILYRRRVVGSQGKEFDAFKFRTMHINGNEILERYPELKRELAENQKLKNDPRITRIGNILRKYSIDEIPQLFNVLLGQMSLVGPRMITLPEVEKYGKWRLNLWTVKPGITGLWQVSGRSDVSYGERVHLDMYYIRNYTVWEDIKILFRTIPVVLGRKGAY